jgi:phosphate/sulfate permease
LKTQLPTRFWIEAALTTASACALVTTLLWRRWIETIFTIDPDRGNGALEWAITLALTATSLTAALLTGAHLRVSTTQALRSAVRGVILRSVSAAPQPAVGGGRRADR